MQTLLSEDEQQHARWAFRRGFAYLMEGKSGNVQALSDAIIYFTITLEWAMPETWPELWREARSALNEAWWLRNHGSTWPRTALDG